MKNRFFAGKMRKRAHVNVICKKACTGIAASILLGVQPGLVPLSYAAPPAPPSPPSPKLVGVSSAPQASSPAPTHSVSAPQQSLGSGLITPAVASSLSHVVNGPSSINIASTGGVLNVGNWINSNTLSIYSSNPNVRTATISSTGSIINPVGASITTIGGLNLVLLAQNGIYNAGSIVSSGALSMTAPVIANVHPSSIGATGAAPVMQAMNGHVNMAVSTLLNQGTISSAIGNINITPINNSSTLAINGVGGSFNALQGLINIGTQNISNQLNLQILGGDFISQALNLTSGATGLLSMQANSVSGMVNATAGDAYIGVNSGLLNLHNLSIGGDPYTVNSNGDIVLTGSDDVSYFSIVSNGSIFNTGSSSILSKFGVFMTANQDIDLTGLSLISTQSGDINIKAQGSITIPGVTMSTNSGFVGIQAVNGAITMPGAHISSNGGGITIVSGADLNLSSSVIDSSAAGTSGGRIFLASMNGSVNAAGGQSLITTGLAPGSVFYGGNYATFAATIAAYNGVTLRDVNAISGDIAVLSGATTTGSIFSGTGFVSQIGTGPVLGSGGITAGTLTTRSSANDPNSLVIVQATNGDLQLSGVQSNGGTVSLLGRNVSVQNGILNSSTAAQGGNVTIVADGNLAVNSIVNDALNGSAGTVYLSGNQASGTMVVSGISNNAAVDGGTVQVLNIGGITLNQGGIKADASGKGSTIYVNARIGAASMQPVLTVSGVLDASSSGGAGGAITLFSGGDVNLQSATLMANGQASGGRISVNAANNVIGTGSTIAADSSASYGGKVTLNANSITGGNFNISANGSNNGIGGNVSLTVANSATFNKGDVKISAQGGLSGGSVSISADGGPYTTTGADLSVNSAVFNINPYTGGNGSGGTINLSATGNLTVVGNLHADGIGKGNGGFVGLRSGVDYTLGNGGPTLTARSGASGGDGGTINVSSAGNLTVARGAVLNVNARGANGNGGSLFLNAGTAGGNAGGVTINQNLAVNGVGTGSGGTISISSANTGANGSIVVNSNLTANGGASGVGGNISLTAKNTDSNSNSVEIQVNAGTIAANGGGGGGNVTVDSFHSFTLNGPAITANGTGAIANGGVITLTDGSVGGGGGGAAGGPVTVTSNLLANAGIVGTGGAITVSTTGAGNLVSITGTKNITALGGTTSGSGGSISVASDAGVSVSGMSINASALGVGDGGSVTVTAGKAAAGDLDLAAHVSADAGTTGRGGTIQLTSLTRNVNITQNPNASQTNISARGGKTSGDGSQNVSITAANNLTLDNAVISVNAQGDGSGGNVSLTAGTGSSGDLSFAGTVLANAGAVGTGGTINLTSVSGNITQGDTSVPVILKADGGSKGGDAGTITLTANSGGIALGNSKGEITAIARGDGNGGTVLAVSMNDQNLQVASIIVNAQGAGQAGSISLTSNEGNVSTSANLLASETGKSGNAGYVVVLAPNGGTNVAGEIHADASNGDGGEIIIDGPGGDVNGGRQSAKGLKGGDDIQWGVPFIKEKNVDVSGINSGGIVLLGALGNIQIDGNVDASSTKGSAGAIIIQANQSQVGSTPFKIGVASPNGIAGSVTNTGVSTTGGVTQKGISVRAGTTIQDMGTGGMQILDAGIIHVNIDSREKQQGQTLSLSTPNGTLTIVGGHLDLNSVNSTNRVVLQAKEVDFQGDASISVNSTRGIAGSIYISANRIESTSSVDLSATGIHPATAPFGLDGLGGQILLEGAGGVSVVPIVVTRVLSIPTYITIYAAPLIQGNSGNLTISGAGLTLHETGGTGGFATIAANNLSLNAPIFDSTTKSLMVRADSISQMAQTDLLAVSANGTLDIKTTGLQTLGSLFAPLALKAPNLKISTLSSAFLSIAGDTTMGTSTVLGNLQITSSGSINSSGILTVRQSAQITTANNLGSLNSPFKIGGQSSASFTASFTALRNINVLSSGSIKVSNAAAGGYVRLLTQNNGSITLDGAIMASGGQTTLITDGSGRIILTAGSSIASLGNVSLLAGGGRFPLVNRPKSPAAGAIVYGGTALVSGPPKWENVFLAGSNSLTTSTSRIIVDPGLIQGSSIVFSGGDRISAGQGLAFVPVQNIDDNEIVPVAFTELSSISLSRSIPQLKFASVGNSDFYSAFTPNIKKTMKGLQLLDGKVVVHHKGNPVLICAGNESIILKGDVVAEITCRNSRMSVTNFTDAARDSVLVKTTDGAKVYVMPGERLTVGQMEDLTPKRLEVDLSEHFGVVAKLSEVSLPYLLTHNQVLLTLSGRSKLFGKVMQTAACLETIRKKQDVPFK